MHDAPSSTVPAPVRAALHEHDLVIFDLDGTLRRCTVPGQPCPNQLGEQEPLAGARHLLVALSRHGVRLAVATNQAGIALGHLTQNTHTQLVEEMLGFFGLSWGHGTLSTDDAGPGGRRADDEAGPQVLVYTCPHHPKAGCTCRKPAPGLLEAAMHEAGVVPRRTAFVGDMESDRLAAERAGVAFFWAHEAMTSDTPPAHARALDGECGNARPIGEEYRMGVLLTRCQCWGTRTVQEATEAAERAVRAVEDAHSDDMRGGRVAQNGDAITRLERELTADGRLAGVNRHLLGAAARRETYADGLREGQRWAAAALGAARRGEVWDTEGAVPELREQLAMVDADRRLYTEMGLREAALILGFEEGVVEEAMRAEDPARELRVLLRGVRVAELPAWRVGAADRSAP